MTTLHKPVQRVANDELGGGHGRDKHRRIVVTLIPGNGKDVPDLISLRPQGTRRSKSVAIVDVYSYIQRCEANKVRMEKARLAKQKKAEAKERRRSRRIILGGVGRE